ncbi:MAG TPA: hypothetical protein PK668_08410 [Myxococcota bacterium]|nr:hypothetical protein [Myxococcota bacterium]HRY93001.1 hypothetical protein [Myxococcota bacterium]HSA21953.1 hypothetical protein [Myxococcota bacterium]
MDWKRALCVLIPAVVAGLTGCEDNRITDISRVPSSVQITVDPLQDSYRVGDTVSLGYAVLDQDGVVLDGVPATWETPPPDTILQGLNGRWEFIQEGEFTWRVRLDPPFELLADEVTLLAPRTPASLEIVVEPEQDMYLLGDEVSVRYLVRDRLGAELAGQPVDWQTPDAAAAEPVGGDLYAFRREGVHTWVASLPAPWNLRAERALRVDGDGPELLLEFPERGDTLLKDAPTAEVPVRGQALDAGSGVRRVSVRTRDGQEHEAALDPGGAFTLRVPAVAGLNTLEVVAEDEVGQATRLTRAFYYAADYLAAEAVPTRLVPQAWDASLFDRALDRGRPDDVPPYDPCGFDAAGAYTCAPLADLASLLEVGLNTVSFEELPAPVLQTFPLVDQTWDIVTLGTLDLDVQLQGRFEIELSFSELGAGEAKVFELASRQDGLHTLVSFRAWTDAQGVWHPGLRAELGLLGTLTFEVSLRLSDASGITPAVACPLATLICGNGHCLDEYLEVCTTPAPPRPVAILVSTLSTPSLVGLSASGMSLDADLLAFLDAAGAPQVTLDQMTLAVEQGGLDLSALDSLQIDLGQVDVVGYLIDLGTYQLDTQFIADLADQLLDPVLDALQPVLEWALGELLTCEDTVDPLCFFVPFLEDVLAAFQPPAEVSVADPFGGLAPLVVAPFAWRQDELLFRAGFGGRFDFAGRTALPRAPAVSAHADDDHLGQPLLGGCLAADPGFLGQPGRGRGLQSVPAVDLANMLLEAAWDAGGLDLELDQVELGLDPALGLSALALTLRPTLAPLLNLCAGAGAALELQIGDLGFSLVLTREGQVYQAAGYLSLAQAAGVELRAEQLAPVPGEVRHALLELDGLTVDGQPASGEQLAWLEGLLADTLGPALLARVSGAVLASLSALEPSFDLAGFPGLDPALSGLVLADPLVDVAQARFIVHADLATP